MCLFIYIYEIGEDITFTILYNYYYDHKTTDENDYSVCFMLKHGSRNYLFTGDLEQEGEEKLSEYYELPQVEVFKGGHHGSPTSSNECLLQEIRPKMVCVCCCAGSVEYTQNPDNTFPSQEFINRVSKYTDKVYVTTMGIVGFEIDSKHGTSDDKSFYRYDSVTGKYIYTTKEEGEYKAVDTNYLSMNGNIRVISNPDGVTVNCSNNNTILKDSDWYKTYRNNIDEWKN